MSKACPWGRGNVDLKGMKLTSEQKDWLGKLMDDDKISLKKCAVKYNLSMGVLSKYLKRFREGLNTTSNGGRPKKLSSPGKLAFKLRADTGRVSNSSNKNSDVINEIALEEHIKNGKAANTFKPLSKRTVARIKKKVGLKSGNASPSTRARIIACLSIKNAISFAAMNKLMVTNCKPHLILNSDATQFKVGCDSNQKIIVEYVLGIHGRKMSLKAEPDKQSAGIVAFYIKYYLLMSAAGVASDAVYVIQNSFMPAGEIDVYEVHGLQTHSGIEGKGYVVFCESRACNLKFYKWYVQTILIPHVNNIRRLKNFTLQDHCWYQLDGEEMQIQCFEHQDIIDLLKAANITVGKPPGSTTEITQPCDAGYIFESAKATGKTLNDGDVSDNIDMVNILNGIVQQHRIKYIDKDGKKMTDAHKKMAVHGLLRVQLCLMVAISPRKIQESFRKCGIYPFDLDTIFNNCTNPIFGFPLFLPICRRRFEI